MLKKLGFALLAVMLFELVSLTQTQTASAAYSPTPGDLVRTQSDAGVYYIDDGNRLVAVSASAYKVRYNNDFAKIKVLPDRSLEKVLLNTDVMLNTATSVKEGSLIIYNTDNPTIYLVENGKKRGFTSWEAFTSRGYKMSQVQWVGTYTIYATGSVIK